MATSEEHPAKRLKVSGAADAVVAKDDKATFLAVCEELREFVLAELQPLYEMPDEAVKWIGEMFDYTVKGGKMNRGLTVLHARRTIKAAAVAGGSGGGSAGELSATEVRDACVLGWCVEILQAFFLVADDVMDDSVTRRGQPCWYLRKGVGNIAINDAFLLQSTIYRVLRKYFRPRGYYMALLEHFNEVTYQTELGQLLDLTSQPMNAPPDLERFTEERYYSIVKYKTAFYSFEMPVKLALLLSGYADEAIFAQSRAVLVDMGVYFQVQDDYLDCYGAPEVIGKVGTDIQDNKCGWLIVQALKICSKEQRELLKEHYGRKSAESEAKVKALYRELDLTSIYEAYEAAAYERLKAAIGEIKGVPSNVYTGLLAKIFKRSK